MDTPTPNIVDASIPQPTTDRQTDPVEVERSPLTPRQKRFVEEYLLDRNGASAYYRAFGRTHPDGSLKSEATGAVEACRLLANPNVQNELKLGEERIVAALRVNQERIVDTYAAIAFVDPADAFEVDVVGRTKCRPPMDLPPALRRAITQIEVKDTPHGQTFKYKFTPREVALEKLCKHLGIKAGEDTSSEVLAKLLEQLIQHRKEQK